MSTNHSVPTRRRLFLCVLLLLAPPAIAASSLLDSLTSKDASGGLKAALSQGIDTAVAQLGATNGFLNDPKVTIPLPPALQKADRALRKALDGLFSRVADEERAIRKDPMGQTSSLIKKVFSAAR